MAEAQYNTAGQLLNPQDVAQPEPTPPTPVDGFPPVSPGDAPFSETVIPRGWAVFPTAEQVAYLNEKYPTTSVETPVAEPPPADDTAAGGAA